jgi:hypothetical protein
MNWLTTACSSKRICCLSPITRSRRGPPRDSRNSFVARALSRQGSKCRILSVLIGSIFDRDRIRFSCFRYASDEIWTVPWRGATGYFGNRRGLRKMAYPPSTRSRFDAKPAIRRKIKFRSNPESFFVRAWTSCEPAALGCSQPLRQTAPTNAAGEIPGWWQK